MNQWEKWSEEQYAGNTVVLQYTATTLVRSHLAIASDCIAYAEMPRHGLIDTNERGPHLIL
jgi:hypothetical protein